MKHKEWLGLLIVFMDMYAKIHYIKNLTNQDILLFNKELKKAYWSS